MLLINPICKEILQTSVKVKVLCRKHLLQL